MKREDYICVFCGSESNRKYKNKAICDVCFNDIHEWSKHSKITDELFKINKLIKNHINNIEDKK